MMTAPIGTVFVCTAACVVGFASSGRAQTRRNASPPNEAAAAAQQGDTSAVDARTRAELEAARDAIWRAWFEHDTVALARLLPAAAAAGEPNGWQARDAILAGSRAFAASGTRFLAVRFTNTRFQRHGDVAVLFSEYTVETERGGNRSESGGQATEVFVRANGVWQNPFWYLAHR